MMSRFRLVLAATVIALAPVSAALAGPQGGSRLSESNIDAATGSVTVSFSVRDALGALVPNLHPENFAVFENGIRHTNVTAAVEHAPITVAVLVEMGGRSLQWNKRMGSDAAYMIRPLLDRLGREDRLAVFTYDGSVHTVVGFDSPHEKWEEALYALEAPRFSETNFHDAAVRVLDRVRGAPGRKALLLLTTGIDTFSRATFDDVVSAAQRASTPIYTIALGHLARRTLLDAANGPLARVEWSQLDQQLTRLGRVSGGRTYTEATPVGMPAIYDEILEMLRVRYALSWVPTATPAPDHAPDIEVRLIDAKSGEPLQVVDATTGRLVTARVLYDDEHDSLAATASPHVPSS